MPASQRYPETLPDVINYAGSSKYARNFKEISLRREKRNPQVPGSLLPKNVIDQRLRLLEIVKSRTESEYPQLLYIIPLHDSFAESLANFFLYLHDPISQKNNLVKASLDLDTNIALETLPDAKNLERYFDLFPPDLSNSFSFEKLVPIKENSFYNTDNPFERFNLDEESMRALEEAASYLANDSEEEVEADEQKEEK